MEPATDIFTVLKDCARESGSLGQGIGVGGMCKRVRFLFQDMQKGSILFYERMHDLRYMKKRFSLSITWAMGGC